MEREGGKGKDGNERTDPGVRKSGKKNVPNSAVFSAPGLGPTQLIACN